uniref:Uncharacterized protein n=1 Tax=Anopheles melas TaxID=34690 RepID=A0A2C9H4W6_9DIPT
MPRIIIICYLPFPPKQVVPIFSYHEILSNEKYVNATIVEVGDDALSKSYLVYFDILHVTLFSYSVRALNGAIKTKILSRWVDGCEIVRRPPTDRMVRLFYDVIANSSKLIYCPYQPGYKAMLNVTNVTNVQIRSIGFLLCPYKPGVSIMLNVTPSDFPMPTFLPESEFLVEVRAYTRARADLIFETRWYGRLVRMFNVNKNIYKNTATTNRTKSHYWSYIAWVHLTPFEIHNQ